MCIVCLWTSFIIVKRFNSNIEVHYYHFNSSRAVKRYTKLIHRIQYNAMQYNTLQYNTLQYNTIHNSTIHYITIQYICIELNRFFSRMNYITKLQYSANYCRMKGKSTSANGLAIVPDTKIIYFYHKHNISPALYSLQQRVNLVPPTNRSITADKPFKQAPAQV